MACGEYVEESFAVPLSNSNSEIFESDTTLEVYVFPEELQINCDLLKTGPYSAAQQGQLLFRMPASVLNKQSFFFSTNLNSNIRHTLMARIVDPGGEHISWQTCHENIDLNDLGTGRIILQFGRE